MNAAANRRRGACRPDEGLTGTIRLPSGLRVRHLGSKDVSAHLGTIFERHTEKTASRILDFREKGPILRVLQIMYTLYRVVTP